MFQYLDEYKFVADKDYEFYQFLEKNKLSKNLIESAILHKNLFLNQTLIIKKPNIIKNDILRIIFPMEENELSISGINIDIVFEDAHFLIANKPFAMPTIPTLYHYADNLLCALKATYPYKLYPVTRLDKDASGLVILAKNSLIHSLLNESMQNIERKYFAEVKGKLCGEGELSFKIDKIDGIKRGVIDSGKQCITKYKVIESGESSSTVEVTLITGRTHQIRVSFAHIGHPILGDCIYGDGVGELKLICHNLAFIHPITQVKIVAEI